MKTSKKNVRYNILIIFTYIIGIIIIVQLFNLQIVHGNEYLEQANSRLTRETTIKAARGNIVDRNGILIAGNTYSYSVNLYKSKIDETTLNNTILHTIEILEKNGDKYIDNFPITIEPYQYRISNVEKWLDENNIDNTLSAEEVLNIFAKKYNLESFQDEDARKIISVRYGIEKQGYSSMTPYTISNNISDKSVAEFEEQKLSLAGISVEYQPIRNYKYGKLASHIIGYIGKINEEEYKANPNYDINDYIGKTGLEYVLEKYLKGQDGTKQIDMSIDGTTTGEYVTCQAIEGSQVVLTIDAKIQEVAETALKSKIEKKKKKKKSEVNNGAAVVINVQTGEVIAMGSYPDFEPELFVNGISIERWNEYTQEGKSALINRSIQSANAPGSIFKMVSAIAGLQTGVITVDETIYDAGVYPKGHNPKCWIWTSSGRTHGNLSVSGAIKDSCNYFFYEVGSRMGIEPIEKYATYFGLGQKTNVELPGEISGTLAGKKLYEKLGQTWYYGNTLSAVIGQAENNFTPIQIAKYIAMLSNGGKKINVSVIKDIINADDSKVDKEEISKYVAQKLGLEETEQEDLEINPQYLEAVLEGMKSVTTETGGTAYSVFKNFPIEVGGKTGSAEAGGKINAWFAGFAPFDNPEIAVVVFVENGLHGYNTAEVVRDILESYFGTNEEVNEDKTVLSYSEKQN